MGTLNVASLNSTSLNSTNLTSTGGNINIDGTWTGAPVGTIIGTAYGSSTTQVVLAASKAYTEIANLTYTTKAANSIFFLTGYAHCYGNGGAYTSSTRANIGFEVVSGGVTTRITGFDGASGGDSWGTQSYPGCILARHDQYTSSFAAGTACTFKLLGASYDLSAAKFNTSGYNHKCVLTLFEIAT